MGGWCSVVVVLGLICKDELKCVHYKNNNTTRELSPNFFFFRFVIFSSGGAVLLFCLLCRLGGSYSPAETRRSLSGLGSELQVKDLGGGDVGHLLQAVVAQGAGGAHPEGSRAAEGVVGPLHRPGVGVRVVVQRQGVVVVEVVVHPRGKGLGAKVVRGLEGPLVVVLVVQLEVELPVVRRAEAVQVPAHGGGGLVVHVEPRLQVVGLALDLVGVLEPEVLVRNAGVAQEVEGGGVVAHVVRKGEVPVLPGGDPGGDVVLSGPGEVHGWLQVELHRCVFFWGWGCLCAWIGLRKKRLRFGFGRLSPC